MLTGKYQGRDIGTSDVWRFNDAVRSGEMSEEELRSPKPVWRGAADIVP